MSKATINSTIVALWAAADGVESQQTILLKLLAPQSRLLVGKCDEAAYSVSKLMKCDYKRSE